MIERDLARAATVSRRAFLGGLVGAGFLAPLAARAQQPDRFFRIGMIERTSIAVNAVNVQSFRHGLRVLGYVEGEHFVIEYRSAEGQDQRCPGLVSELARLKVDLLVTNYPEMYRRAAGFAHKIFRGAKPADLPVEEPTAFELVINLRTARSLGLTIPPSLLLRADYLVE